MARQNILICGGARINSIEDLYDSFNFEELKRCIAVGKLQFWMRTNGHDAEAAAVEKLDLAAADADLQLLAALNAPEDKRDAFLARKREEEEAARLAAKQAEEEANAVKTEEQEQDEIFDKVKGIIRTNSDRPWKLPKTLLPNHSLKEDLYLEWTTIDSIAKEVGQAYGFQFPFDAGQKMKTVGDLVEFALKHTGKGNIR